MTARFAGICRRCGDPIPAGTEIFYAKGQGPRHADAKACKPESAPAPSFTPTAEQEQALTAFATGRSLVIEAGAGTGKTATLRLLAARGVLIVSRAEVSAMSTGRPVEIEGALEHDWKGDPPGLVYCEKCGVVNDSGTRRKFCTGRRP